MKLVVVDGFTLNPGDLSWDGYRKFGELTVYEQATDDEAEAISRIGDADIAITNETRITKNIIDACPDLKLITIQATGYDTIDYEYARTKGIPVCNVPGYGTASVAQYAISLLLEICGRVGYHNDAVHEGRWQRRGDWSYSPYPLIELAGKTMGIIGFGRIGRAVGRAAKGLGMEVIAYNRSQSESGAQIAEYVTLDELYRRSDVISLHVPSFPETVGMINRDSIARMKDGVILINNSRGALVVEQDLADALNSGKVYAAGLDVLCTEPVEADNPLLTAKNCFITPHISWTPREARQRIIDITDGNIRAFLEGKPRNVVNG